MEMKKVTGIFYNILSGYQEPAKDIIKTLSEDDLFKLLDACNGVKELIRETYDKI